MVKSTYGAGYAVESRTNMQTDVAYTSLGFGGWWHTAAERGGTTITGWGTADGLIRQAASGDSYVVTQDLEIGNWARFKIYNGGTTSTDWELCVNASCQNFTTLRTAAIPSPQTVYSSAAGATIEVDWLAVRKAMATETDRSFLVMKREVQLALPGLLSVVL